MAYMFFYSERPGTLAAKRYEDDIPEEVKKRRLTEIIDLQRAHSIERNKPIWVKPLKSWSRSLPSAPRMTYVDEIVRIK